MNKIMISLVVAFFMLSGFSYADVYVMHIGEKLVGLSERNDMVLEPGAEITIIKGNIADLSLSLPLDDYKFTGNKFSIDTKRVADKRKKEAELQTEIDARKDARKSGIEKLKAVGLTDAEISAIIGK